MNPWATGLILPTLLNQVETAGKWQVKTGSLSIIDKLVKIAPEPCSKLMPDMVPVLAGAIWDTKADVKKAAKASMTNATALVSNKDIEKYVTFGAQECDDDEHQTLTARLVPAQVHPCAYQVPHQPC